MANRERLIVTSVLAVLLFGWLGFLLHVSSRFAGSGLGAVFGISAAVLMFVPLGYVIVKRIRFIRERTTRFVSLQTWLSIHIYSSIIGALLALIHTGHKYVSPLGIALTATMLLVVVSGYVLRYLVPFVNLDMKDKLLLLQTARGDLDHAWGVLEKSSAADRRRPKMRFLTAGLASLGVPFASASPAGQVVTLADGVTNLEYSVRTDELLRRWFARSLAVHIILSFAMYGLLTAHITSGIYFGLRWFR